VKALVAAPRALTPLALIAAVLAVVVPSQAVADRSDLLLGALVLATALGITAAELRDDLRRHRTSILVLSVAPIVILSLAAWAVGRLFDARRLGPSPSPAHSPWPCATSRWPRRSPRRRSARARAPSPGSMES
jgi:predicted Na+-dependent transporter